MIRGLLLALVTVALALAQEPRPIFEVAIVKPNRTNDPGAYSNMGGATPSMRNQTLRGMILWAYSVRDFQLDGGPKWVDSERYDLQGRTTPNATIDQRRLMLQSLLTDRFKLGVHRETKELPIFNLIVAKGGLKVRPIVDGNCLPANPQQAQVAKASPNYCGGWSQGRGSIQAAGSTMPDIAQMLSTVVGRKVVDKTEASGLYRVNVEFSYDTAVPSDAPSLFTALEEQLGLKLDSAKGPVEVLVIDHAEKPAEN